jgi:hypothetical protein
VEKPVCSGWLGRCLWLKLILMQRCIYCLELKGAEYFNKEHVVPCQLGTFQNSQTLVLTVCSDCNSYFGQDLENTFGRNSFEAILRLRHGQKSARDFTGFPRGRLSFRLPAGKPGAGVVVIPAPSPDGSEIMLMLPPQVGVQRLVETDYRYHTEDDLRRDGPRLLPAGMKANLRLLSGKEDEAGLDRLRELVRTLMPKFREEGELRLPPPERIDNQIIVEVRGTIDKVIARAVAKIAFNYMAKHAGTEFVLNPSFHQIRRFIRYDEGGNDWRQFVRLRKEHLLGEETEELSITRGHVLMLDWPGLSNPRVRVSPYNSIIYEVMMARAYSGVWVPLRFGHVFDWEHHVVHELYALRHVILPPGALQRPANAYAAIVGGPPSGRG